MRSVTLASRRNKRARTSGASGVSALFELPDLGAAHGRHDRMALEI